MTVRLNIINSMLATTGTSALSAEDTSHPDYIDASVTLDSVLLEYNSRELWFNSYVRTFQANSAGEIIVPSNALSCESVDRRDEMFIKGTKLWDNKNFTFNIARPIKCRVITSVELDDMPPAALAAVRAQARYEFFVDQDGSQKKSELLFRKYDQAERALDQINLRQASTNFFDGEAAANFYTRRYPGSTRGRITRY